MTKERDPVLKKSESQVQRVRYAVTREQVIEAVLGHFDQLYGVAKDARFQFAPDGALTITSEYEMTTKAKS